LQHGRRGLPRRYGIVIRYGLKRSHFAFKHLLPARLLLWRAVAELQLADSLERIYRIAARALNQKVAHQRGL